MDRWFFGLGKEKEKTLYPPTREEEDSLPFPQNTNKQKIQDFYSKTWNSRTYDQSLLELVTINISKTNREDAPKMIATIDDCDL